jgi:hypothetical protein
MKNTEHREEVGSRVLGGRTEYQIGSHDIFTYSQQSRRYTL